MSNEDIDVDGGLKKIGFVCENGAYLLKDDAGDVTYILVSIEIADLMVLNRVVPLSEGIGNILGFYTIPVTSDHVFDIVETLEEYFKKIEGKIFLTPKLQDQILNSYKWIKVKKYTEAERANPMINWESEYYDLLEHHKKETSFLIDFTRKLVSPSPIKKEIKFLIDKPKNGFSHLVSNDVDKLHEYAEAVGIKRRMFENKRGKNQPHYDIKEEDFDRIVAHGAKVVENREIIVFLKKHFS